MKLAVPYYSQFLDVNDKYWMPRSCGFCCLTMVLDYYGKEIVPIEELARNSEAEGGYGKSGIVHDWILDKLRESGLDAHREEKINGQLGIKKIESMIHSGNPVIVSVDKKLLGQHKFHQVVIVGIEDERGLVEGFYFHDPESLSRDLWPSFVSTGDFLSDWRGMAIFIKR